MGFLVFSLLFAGVLYLHFLQAHRAWRAIRGRQSLELDMGYVRMENYFGHSFRRKLKQWLETLPMAPGAGAGVRVYDHGRERIYVTREVRYPAGRVEREMVVSEGVFSCSGWGAAFGAGRDRAPVGRRSGKADNWGGYDDPFAGDLEDGD
jgi:hypothetical protein